MVYIPTSRDFLPGDGPAATIYLVLPLPEGSSGQPGDLDRVSCFPLLGLAPDGVCLASDVTIGAVSSYLAVSPLPFDSSESDRSDRQAGAVCFCGTFRRVTPPRR